MAQILEPTNTQCSVQTEVLSESYAMYNSASRTYILVSSIGHRTHRHADRQQWIWKFLRNLKSTQSKKKVKRNWIEKYLTKSVGGDQSSKNQPFPHIRKPCSSRNVKCNLYTIKMYPNVNHRQLTIGILPLPAIRRLKDLGGQGSLISIVKQIEFIISSREGVKNTILSAPSFIFVKKTTTHFWFKKCWIKIIWSKKKTL